MFVVLFMFECCLLLLVCRGAIGDYIVSQLLEVSANQTATCEEGNVRGNTKNVTHKYLLENVTNEFTISHLI